MGAIQSVINQGLAIGSALYTQMKKEETTQEKLKKTQKQYDKYKKGAQTHLKNVREKYENIIKQYDKEKQGLAIDRTMEQMNISKTIKPKLKKRSHLIINTNKHLFIIYLFIY